jgi:DNA-binding response OmpR family regulator
MSTLTIDPPAPELSVQPDHRLVYVDGEPLELTYLEYELLAHLVAHPLRVHSRAQLLQLVWGWPAVPSRTVDTHVARLRSKLGDLRDSIETVHRVGYRYRPLRTSKRVSVSRAGTAA